jgi:type IV secretion system protein VirB6
MEGIYKEMIGIFDEALETIHDGLYESGAALFNNMFFNLAFTLTVCYLGYLLMFQKMKTEELAYKMIWLIIVFTLVKGILAKQWLYIFFLEIINAPANSLLEMVRHIVTGANENANLENIVETLIFALRNVHDTIYAKGSWDNWLPYMYALLLNLAGTFTIVAILLFSIFSIFLAKTVLALSPFIIIFLLWKKTEYIFFNWLRLYVSLSLYPAMTVLFGLVCYQVAKYMQNVATGLPEGGFEEVIAICIALVLVGLAVFRIPNIINQVIGSANEGSSLSGGLATMSAGAALVAGVVKWSGAKLGGEAAGKGLGAAGGLGVDALKKKWFNSK